MNATVAIKNPLELTLDDTLPGTHATWKEMLTDQDLTSQHQQGLYKNPQAVFMTMGLLREVMPLTRLEEIKQLKKELALVAKGEAVIIQAGLCAEDIADKSKPTAFVEMIHTLEEIVHEQTGKKVVLMGRIAGQLTKPRTKGYEEIGGVTVQTYRGHMVNGSNIDEREPSPQRMIDAYTYSNIKLSGLKDENSGKTPVYASHEGLCLPYENGMMQQEREVLEIKDGVPVYGEEIVYAGSAPFLWVGDRTRQIKGPHVAFAAMVANPIGVKVNANTKPEELDELINEINPNKEPGKLTLIFRMGRDKAEAALPALMDVVKKYKESVIAICDPMHGNTKTDLLTGQKTRYVEDIKQEVVLFTEACLKKGIHPGGIHLEASGDDVTECLGSGVHYLGTNYQTLCDPCLNPNQAAGVALVYAEATRRQPKMH